MPHIVIEHTEKTAAKMADVCKAVFEAACGCETFPNPEAVKVRSRLCANHTGGTGDDFVHATVRMLAGRTNDLKSEVSQAVLGALESAFPNTASLTCEIVDMHGESYAKRYL